MGFFDIFKKKPVFRALDGYVKKDDGYIENPLAHHRNATSTQREAEYFMQWIYPKKLERVSLRTPVGYRLTHGRAKDVWNNQFGIKLPDSEEKAKELNKHLIPYLRSRRFFREGQKFSGYRYSQGESIWLLYFKDGGNLDNFANPVSMYDEVLEMEAISPIDYYIPDFDKYGEPERYEIAVRGRYKGRSIEWITVHPSRVIRGAADNLERRYRGYSDIAAVYDSIVILSSILKSAGEAAFRWGTGHPVFFTKGLITEAEFEELESKLGDITRRSWHMMPSEVVEDIKMLGEAGSMLNIKSLADICIDQIVIGTGFPKPILLGEVAGVISGSEVNLKEYFAILDEDQTELEPIIREYFRRDVNIRRMFKRYANIEISTDKHIPTENDYLLDWGIRHVFDRREQVEIDQKEISNALALSQIMTIDEVRKRLGFDPIGSENFGDIILGLEPFYMFQMQMEAQAIMAEEMGTLEPQNNTNYNQSVQSTEKQKNSTQKDLEKNKDIGPRMDSRNMYAKLSDAFEDVLSEVSLNKLSDELHLYPKTLRKIIKNLKQRDNI